MKKLVLFVAIALIFFACRKDDEAKQECFDGYVIWGGPIAADGLGWYIRGDSATGNSKYYIPDNLPKEYEIDSLPISVCLVEIKKKFNCECYDPLTMYKILSIKRR